MTKSKSIRKFCLTCGGSPKDVAFCSDPNCELWEHRLGMDLRSTKGRKIMEDNCRRYPRDFAELGTYGVDPARYLPAKPHNFGRSGLNKGVLAPKSSQNDEVDPEGGGDQ